MNTVVDNPNLSVIMPVGCNASCNFCYWKKGSGLNLRRLETIIMALPSKFSQVTITGGEPTAHPELAQYIALLRKRFDKIVLNTNGFRLTTDLALSVDHVNLSRHRLLDSTNRFIFRTSSVPDWNTVAELAKLADITLNCYVDPDEFIAWNLIGPAAQIGAKVAFRVKQGTLTLLDCDTDDTLIREHSCGVCRHRVHSINSIEVTFKYGLKETDANGIYELIIHPDGRVCSDWAGYHEVVSGVVHPYLGEDYVASRVSFSSFGGCGGQSMRSGC